jgi:hypothetical protein
MSFLKEERGGLLKKRLNLVLEKWSEVTLLLVSRWICALVGALEYSCLLGRMLAMMSPKLFWVLHRRRNSTARLGNCQSRVFPRKQGSPQ